VPRHLLLRFDNGRQSKTYDYPISFGVWLNSRVDVSPFIWRIKNGFKKADFERDSETVERALDREEHWCSRGLAVRQNGGPLPLGTIEVDGVTYADLRGFRALGSQIPQGATLKNIDFSYSRLSTPFCRAADCRFVRTDWQGGYLTDFFERCDFTAADCRQANISKSIFVDCQMSHINLTCCGGHASFQRCDLSGAFFREASISHLHNVATSFAHCNLTQAKFGFRNRDQNEDDMPHDFPRWLSGVYFISCNIGDVNWGGADLSAAEFLPEDKRPKYVWYLVATPSTTPRFPAARRYVVNSGSISVWRVRAGPANAQ